MSASSITSSTSTRTPRRTLLALTISAWAAPLMVVGDFAFMAVIPVAVALTSALRNPRARSLRWPAGILAAVYATPLAIWLLRPNGAQSLSKDIHPVFIGLIVAASALLLVRIYTRKD